MRSPSRTILPTIVECYDVSNCIGTGLLTLCSQHVDPINVRGCFRHYPLSLDQVDYDRTHKKYRVFMRNVRKNYCTTYRGEVEHTDEKDINTER